MPTVSQMTQGRDMNRYSQLAGSLTLLVGLVFFTSHVFARGNRAWTYQELYDEADLVVMCTALPPARTENTDKFKPAFLQQLESVLEVHAMLKASMYRKRIKLVHFEYREDIEFGLGNGPGFVALETKRSPGKAGKKPLYLLFLRSRTDGRYEPVSGNMDPEESVMQLLSEPTIRR